MSLFRLADPWFLLIGLAIPLLFWLRWIRNRRHLASFRFSKIDLLAGADRSLASKLSWLPAALRAMALILLVLAFARPQAGETHEEVLTRGVDIVMVLDNSSSMAAEDFRPRNRLAVAKDAVAAFVGGRKSDRLGLVVFAGRGYTACPLTLDYDVLLEVIGDLDLAQQDEGTAIGMGLGIALNRLRESDARSKVVVLLTDGRNNRGEIDPITAASLAKTLGIKIHAIGVGTRGEAPYPVDDPILGKRYVYLRADIDEPALKEVAAETGGRYFRATDRESLHQIFQEIDGLEKTEIKVKHYTQYSELFPWFVWPALGLFMVELGLANTRLRRIP
jgi:Ca-activated chloride channel family protein